MQESNPNPELRTGDSARAKFFRLKDEILNFPANKLLEKIRENPEKHTDITDLFGSLMKIRTQLTSEENNEEALAEGEKIMRQISEIADNLGLRNKE